MSPKKRAQKSAKGTTAIGETFKGFTDEERVAMKERVQELKAAAHKTAFALKELTAAEEARIGVLVKQAVS